MAVRLVRLSPVAAVVLLAACGGGGGTTTVTVTETVTRTVTVTAPTETTPTKTTRLRVYFLHDAKVQPVARAVPQTSGVAAAAFSALRQGPTAVEGQLGLTTAMPEIESASTSLESGELTVKTDVPLSGPALAQTVYTLTQFPDRRSVVVNGKRYTRADFEDSTPAILVESPLPFETVHSPLRATGTANTFEATFDYELTDWDGRIIKDGFVTATSGSGVRGTFDFTVPYTTDRSGIGSLIVFERSAKDGSRIHLVEIPIRLEK